MKTIRMVLGDQLSHSISSLKDCDKKNDIVLMVEVMEETTYVPHHKKKIAFIFSAMRHFAAELQQNGYHVRYIKLDDPANTGSFTGEVMRVARETGADRIVVTHPGEYRVLTAINQWPAQVALPVEIIDDTRFLCTPTRFAAWADGRKNLRMEFFYREMRKEYAVLMDNGSPVGGEWNYDSENRKSPPDGGLFVPKPTLFTPDEITQKVLDLVAGRFANHFGDLLPFGFAVTRQQALQVLDAFITERLPHFGDYQDAMVENEPWLYHSHISFYLNCGLLEPLEVIQRAEQAFIDKKAPLNAVEGFIRQIMGWREFVRGIYWLNMPEYAEKNFLGAQRPLPSLYWNAETDMNCMRQCVTETRQNAYAHHIQRLMVLGNFALLAGLDPKQVCEWYLLVYADAYEWVELPNVAGMILFADGGYLGSKPYAASGAYINKMSNYCKNCRYDVSAKAGPTACPFNYLYWNFMITNHDKLAKNPRLGFTYKTLSAMPADKIQQIKNDAGTFLSALAI